MVSQGWHKYLNVLFGCFFFKNTKHCLILKEFQNQVQANKYIASFSLPNNQALQLSHMLYIMQEGISI